MAAQLFNSNYRCPLCNRLHAIRQCTRFMVMPVEEKLRIVAQEALCYNCLAQSHTQAQCKSLDRCRRCHKNHNSWLHPLPEGKVWVQMTARIRIRTEIGRKCTKTWALIDPTADRSSITRREAEAVQCRIQRGRTTIQVYHSDDKESFSVELAVEDKKYARSPSSSIEQLVRDEVPSCDANRYWHKSIEYSVVLGSDVTNRILIGPAKGRPGSIYVQPTIFGFAYFGEGFRADKQDE